MNARKFYLRNLYDWIVVSQISINSYRIRVNTPPYITLILFLLPLIFRNILFLLIPSILLILFSLFTYKYITVSEKPNKTYDVVGEKFFFGIFKHEFIKIQGLSKVSLFSMFVRETSGDSAFQNRVYVYIEHNNKKFFLFDVEAIFKIRKMADFFNNYTNIVFINEI